jgi:serine/threonine protein kinase
MSKLLHEPNGASGAVTPTLVHEVQGSRRRYEIVRKLGAGGMAQVFLATLHGGEGFMRPVALKVVRPDFSNIAEFSELFIQEARFASMLNHSNVVNVIDFDRDASGRLFLAMEYVDGRDLSALLDGRPVPPSLAIHIAVEALRGLGYAHELPEGSAVRGIVHRDVSPQNILLSSTGAVKVSDFGIAKALTTSGILSAFRGKASYVSPEQAAGHPIDGRSDLFSLGVVLWEMLTAKRLFQGLRPQDVVMRVILGQVARPSTIRPIPADLEAVVMRLLSKAREDRYATASDTIAALVQCHDAPRNGTRELVTFLAKRFPTGSQRAVPAPAANGGGASAERTKTAQITEITETGEESEPGAGSAENAGSSGSGADGGVLGSSGVDADRGVSDPRARSSGPSGSGANASPHAHRAPPILAPVSGVISSDLGPPLLLPARRLQRRRWMLVAAGAAIVAGAFWLASRVPRAAAPVTHHGAEVAPHRAELVPLGAPLPTSAPTNPQAPSNLPGSSPLAAKDAALPAKAGERGPRRSSAAVPRSHSASAPYSWKREPLDRSGHWHLHQAPARRRTRGTNGAGFPSSAGAHGGVGTADSILRSAVRLPCEHVCVVLPDQIPRTRTETAEPDRLPGPRSSPVAAPPTPIRMSRERRSMTW